MHSLAGNMHLKKIAPVFVIIAAAMWGIDSIVLRPALYELPVALVVFVESSLITLILTPFFLHHIRSIKNLSGKEWLAFLGVALFGGAIGTMAITRALFYVNFVNLSIVVLIQKLQPVFTLIGAALLLREKLPGIFFLWASIAIFGAYLMTFGIDTPDLETGDKTTMAAIFALLAAISFALSTVFSKRALRRIEYGLGTYIRFLIFSVVMLIIVLSTGTINDIQSITDRHWMIFLLIALTTGGLATFLYYYGLKEITASLSSICELSFPLTAIVLEFLLHEKLLNWIQWLGVIILFLAIFKVTKLNSSKIQTSGS
jgi:drug/metabolite transporter (DMT)-like permease